jgi:predicted ATPase/DNA-binding CsgD family transcriptional regulator
MTAPPGMAAQVRALRDQLGLTQEQLANRLGVSFVTVNRWEGGHSNPSRKWRDALEGLVPRAAPAGLPRPANSFVGREAEMARLGQLLGDHALVTLVGPGGAGKSRLAVEYLASIPAASNPPAVLDLAALPPGAEQALFDLAAAAIGMPPRPGPVAPAAVAAHLRAVPRLLVVDNCEHLITAVATLVSELPRDLPDLHVLATSREALRVEGEAVVAVGPLALPGAEDPIGNPAVELFIDRARQLFPGLDTGPANLRRIATICRELDGLPLAIEFAAARVLTMSLADLQLRLERSLPALQSPGRTGPARHRTIRAALEWSYDLLSPEERDLFERLSIFRGGFELDAAEAIAEAPGAMDTVVRLVEKSLLSFAIEGETGRYRMLEPVRQFAAEILAGDDREGAVNGALVRFFATLPATHPQGTGALERRLDREIANIRTALEFALANDPEGAFVPLLRTTATFWGGFGRAAEGMEWARRGLSAGTALSTRSLATLNTVGAHSALNSANIETATAFAHAAIAAARESGDPMILGAALVLGGRLGDLAGDFEGAYRHLDEAREVLSKVPGAPASFVDPEQAWALSGMGRIAEARALLQPTLSGSNPVARAGALMIHGDTFVATGAWREALEHYREARQVLTEAGGAYHQANAACREGLALEALGDIAGSAAAFRNAVGHFRAAAADLYGWWILALSLVPLSARTVPEQAALLDGATQAFRDGGNRVMPYWQARYDAAREQACTHLGSGAFEQLHGRGALLPLPKAVEDALKAVEERLAQAAPGQTGRLTLRESEVLGQVAGGSSNKEIALSTGLSVRTVERHLANIYAKLGARGRADAIAWWMRGRRENG